MEDRWVDAANVQESRDAVGRATPNARLAAIREGGLVGPLAESLGYQDLAIRPGRSGVLLVVPEDRASVITAWENVRTHGASRVRIRLAASGTEATFYMFDTFSEHGVYVGVLAADDLAMVPQVPDDVPYVARFAVQRKSDTAVFVEIDDATTSMLGWSGAEMVGKPSLDFVHADVRSVAVKSWIDMLGCPGCTRRVRLRYRHRDGRWVWLELTNHNRLDDTDACVVTECLDVSEEMAAHEVVRAREELLR